jgi:NAD(P)-dependent dehydrogenase (short-subunit alcohol dehydrogenase family)
MMSNLSPLRLQGRVAIVTGAAQGIGARYAASLAAEGATVVCADVIDAEPVAAQIRAAGGRALALRADVSSAESVRQMAAASVEAFGRIDVLVNNAGLFANLAMKPFEQIDAAEWDRVMAVNVRGPFECAKAVLPQMRAQGYGKIVNIASATVFKGSPLLLHYVTSKGAVVAMTRSLARELGDAGIRVNTLAPGLTASENTLANPAWQGAIGANNIASRAI